MSFPLGVWGGRVCGIFATVQCAIAGTAVLILVSRAQNVAASTGISGLLAQGVAPALITFVTAHGGSSVSAYQGGEFLQGLLTFEGFNDLVHEGVCITDVSAQCFQMSGLNGAGIG